MATLVELDKHLKPIEKRWGRPLPFPILLDDDDATARIYGIRSYPTLLLIDPDGRVTEGGSWFLRQHLLRTGPAVVKMLRRLGTASSQGFAAVAAEVAAKKNGDFALRDFANQKATPDEVTAIAQVMRTVSSDEAVGFFCGKHGLESRDKNQRLAAVQTLGDLGLESALSSLREQLRGEKEKGVEGALREAIEKIEAKR